MTNTDTDMRIICGDCVTEMVVLAEQKRKFDLIVADPPYNQGMDYGSGTKADLLPWARYAMWCREWIDTASFKLLSDTGSMWIICPWRLSAQFMTLGRQAGLILRNVIIWHETFGQYAQTNFGNCHRHLLYFTKSLKNFTFNVDAVRIPSKRQERGDKRADPRGKIMTNVWQIPRLVGNAAERIPEVPTQLPRALLRPIVGACTNPGNAVLDPFCGSGTTGVEALRAKCSFTGIDNNADYVKIAAKRFRFPLSDYGRPG